MYAVKNFVIYHYIVNRRIGGWGRSEKRRKNR